jgi:hypothetical protein
MTDMNTGRRVEVRTTPATWPHLMLPLPQLPALKQLLGRHGVAYEVGGHAVSLDGKPAVVVVDMPAAARLCVQALLDAND